MWEMMMFCQNWIIARPTAQHQPLGRRGCLRVGRGGGWPVCSPGARNAPSPGFPPIHHSSASSGSSAPRVFSPESGASVSSFWFNCPEIPSSPKSICSSLSPDTLGLKSLAQREVSIDASSSPVRPPGGSIRWYCGDGSLSTHVHKAGLGAPSESDCTRWSPPFLLFSS